MLQRRVAPLLHALRQIGGPGCAGAFTAKQRLHDKFDTLGAFKLAGVGKAERKGETFQGHLSITPVLPTQKTVTRS
jgi:hypothetical protein